LAQPQTECDLFFVARGSAMNKGSRQEVTATLQGTDKFSDDQWGTSRARGAELAEPEQAISSSGIGLKHDSPLLEALRDVAKTFSRPVVAETE
jgi:hypothetical protein